MLNKKGEISAFVIIGTLVVMGIAAVMSSTVNNQSQITDTRAAGISCGNNPVPPPSGGYTWVANCGQNCTSNADCPQNTADTSNVNPTTSNWCYQFAEGTKCMQLQKGSGNTSPPNTNPTNNPTNPGGTQGGVCTTATGCGGACNSNFNQGCGYGGCRAWEDCVNNTCIDTTNLGTQPAGANACNNLATAGSPENTVPTSGQAPPNTPSPNTSQPTSAPQNPPLQTPTQINTYLPVVGSNPTPTVQIACRSGQIRCLSGECVDFQDECPTAPSPTQTKTYLPLVSQITQNPTPVPTLSESKSTITTTRDIILKACQQGGTFEFTDLTGECAVTSINELRSAGLIK